MQRNATDDRPARASTADSAVQHLVARGSTFLIRIHVEVFGFEAHTSTLHIFWCSRSRRTVSSWPRLIDCAASCCSFVPLPKYVIVASVLLYSRATNRASSPYTV